MRGLKRKSKKIIMSYQQFHVFNLNLLIYIYLFLSIKLI